VNCRGSGRAEISGAGNGRPGIRGRVRQRIVRSSHCNRVRRLKLVDGLSQLGVVSSLDDVAGGRCLLLDVGLLWDFQPNGSKIEMGFQRW